MLAGVIISILQTRTLRLKVGNSLMWVYLDYMNYCYSKVLFCVIEMAILGFTMPFFLISRSNFKGKMFIVSHPVSISTYFSNNTCFASQRHLKNIPQRMEPPLLRNSSNLEKKHTHYISYRLHTSQHT